MKICINALENSADIAPIIFANRLAKELKSMGVEIVDRESKHDILLAFIRDFGIEQSRDRGARIIQRLDGVYHGLDQDYSAMNASISKTREMSDAVIYQSVFSKRMASRYLGPIKDKLEFIVLNGADPAEFQFKNYFSSKPSFLCSARWRPSKRFGSIARGFLEAKISNSKLFVLGEPEKRMESSNINYLGNLPSSCLPNIYSKADFFIHLAYNDTCPNSVVEALVSGLPVICADSGGTKELVGDSGEIIVGDRLSLEPLSGREVPFIDSKKVSDALHKCLDKKGSYDFPRDDLHISNCAKNYLRVFEEVLDTDSNIL